MKLLRYIGKEFRHWFGNWQRAIPVVAIITIPVLYAGTFLWAFWDPYGHLNRLPVAVVNLDSGSTLNGKSVNIGRGLVQSLQQNKDFKWQFVSAANAKTGLQNDEYFMEIEIPANFSQQAVAAATTSVTSENATTSTPASASGASSATASAEPIQPKLISITNDRYNFVASIIGRNAMEKVKEQTAQGLTAQYSKNLIQGLGQLANGVNTAASGATQIATGANTLQTKSSQLVGGSAQLASASSKLSDGAARAQTASGKIAGGSNKLLAGTQQLAQGMGQLATAGTQLQSGANQTLGGLKNVQQAVQATDAAVNQTASGASTLAQGLAQYAVTHPSVANDPAFQQLLGASQQLQQGAQQLATGQQGLVSGTNQLVQAQTQLVSGLGALQTNLVAMHQGANQLATSQGQLVAGTQQLTAGITGLQTGSSQIASGAGQLQTGLTQYTDGVAKVATGATQLATKLHAASHSTPAWSQSKQTQLATVISQPIGLTEVNLGQVTTYGSGFAPYFLSLGLFVGALLMSIVVDFRKPVVRPKSGVAWFLSKFSLLGFIGVMQALIADMVLLGGLGLRVHSVPQYVGFSILTSLTFIAIVQFFVTTLQNPGRFVAILLLILQLTSSSGSYPSVLSPEFFQRIGAYLPMTYAINGFRYLIAGGNLTFMQDDLVRLLGFLFAFTILTLGFLQLRHRREFSGTGDGSSAQLGAHDPHPVPSRQM